MVEESKTSQMQIAGSGSDGSTSALKERNANFGRTCSTVLANKRSLRITPRVWNILIKQNSLELTQTSEQQKQLEHTSFKYGESNAPQDSNWQHIPTKEKPPGKQSLVGSIDQSSTFKSRQSRSYRRLFARQYCTSIQLDS